jgi:enoyl-CoA hydratase/carnithine racemase
VSNTQVFWKIEGKVAVVTIDNPPVNTLNSDILEGLGAVFTELLYQENIYAVVITGSGEKAFVAGADISQFLELNRVTGWNFVQNWVNVFQRVSDFPYPVIAAINGAALGGGLELALACDIRVASKNAKLGVPEVGLGIIPGIGGTQRLPRTISLGYANKMVFTGEAITADEAYRIGLIDQLATTGTVLEETLELANKIASKGPLAIKTAKQVMKDGLNGNLLDGLRKESDGVAILFESEDKTEGVDAFFEKRTPDFKGR